MKSPFDKISAGGNRIFQIIATHRCNLRCTNCTQGQGYVQYDMSVDVFRDCCRGLSDWPGIVGLFGRLPLLHPQIRELLAIIREEIKDPVHRGLWINDIPDKSLVPELQATFTLASTFNLNAHGIPEAFGRMNECFPGRVISDSGHQRAWHSPVRVAIQDFVGTDQLPDEATMWAKIETCHINRDWSGAVYERIRDGKPTAVAAFCEVAAAFDIFYGLDHGVAVEPGFWRWRMDKYAHQHLQWCRQCGVPLGLKGAIDDQESEHYSKTHEPLIQLRNSVKKKAILVERLPVGGMALRTTDYMRHDSGTSPDREIAKC